MYDLYPMRNVSLPLNITGHIKTALTLVENRPVKGSMEIAIIKGRSKENQSIPNRACAAHYPLNWHTSGLGANIGKFDTVCMSSLGVVIPSMPT